MSEAELAANRYDPVEESYFLALGDGVTDREALAKLALAAHEAAKAWHATARPPMMSLARLRLMLPHRCFRRRPLAELLYGAGTAAV